MRSTKLTLLISFLSLFLISCSQKDVSKDEDKNPHMQKAINPIHHKQIPNWITNPNLGVKYGAVGIAPRQQNKKLQRLSAIANAKTKLSDQFREQLQSQMPRGFKQNPKMIGSTINIVALQASQDITRDATIKSSFIDQKGTMYIWVVIE